jgi:hypothetical protein
MVDPISASRTYGQRVVALEAGATWLASMLRIRQEIPAKLSDETQRLCIAPGGLGSNWVGLQAETPLS